MPKNPKVALWSQIVSRTQFITYMGSFMSFEILPYDFVQLELTWLLTKFFGAGAEWFRGRLQRDLQEWLHGHPLRGPEQWRRHSHNAPLSGCVSERTHRRQTHATTRGCQTVSSTTLPINNWVQCDTYLSEWPPNVYLLNGTIKSFLAQHPVLLCSFAYLNVFKN